VQARIPFRHLGPNCGNNLTRIRRTAWSELGTEKREELLEKRQEQVVIPRPLQFFVGELSVDNDKAVEIIGECRGKPVADWTGEALILVTTLWL
jgi:hypothetical protein